MVQKGKLQDVVLSRNFKWKNQDFRDIASGAIAFLGLFDPDDGVITILRNVG
jgi:hypothetical protein